MENYCKFLSFFLSSYKNRNKNKLIN